MSSCQKAAQNTDNGLCRNSIACPRKKGISVFKLRYSFSRASSVLMKRCQWIQAFNGAGIQMHAEILPQSLPRPGFIQCCPHFNHEVWVTFERHWGVREGRMVPQGSWWESQWDFCSSSSSYGAFQLQELNPDFIAAPKEERWHEEEFGGLGSLQ